MDDVSGEPLVQRDDDAVDTVTGRLKVYHEQTEKLVDYYASWAASDLAAAPKYRKISRVGTVEQISERVLAALQAAPTGQLAA